MDPVDGDPFEFSEKAIQDDSFFTLGTPVFVFETGLGDEPGFNIKVWPACAPAQISAHHFYEAFDGPKWLINAVNFGHIDMLDDTARGAVSAIRFCKGASKSDYDLYRRVIAGSVEAFVKYVNGEKEYAPYLSDENLIPLLAEVESDY